MINDKPPPNVYERPKPVEPEQACPRDTDNQVGISAAPPSRPVMRGRKPLFRNEGRGEI